MPVYTVAYDPDYWYFAEYTPARKFVRKSTGELCCVFAGDYYDEVEESRLVIYYSRSLDNGVTWSTPEVVSTNIASYFDAVTPSIAVDSNDDVHVVWKEELETYLNHGIMYRKKMISGWGDVENVSEGTGQHYGEPDEYYYDFEPAIAIDKHDYPHVVWTGRYHDEDGARWSVVWRKKVGVWINHEIVFTGENDWDDMSYLGITIDSYDYVHVSWTQYYYSDGWGKPEIRYSIRTSSWGVPELVSASGQMESESCIALEPDNSVVLVWGGSVSSSYPYNIRLRRRNGSWGDIENLTNDSSGDIDNWSSSIALETDETIHVVWRCRDKVEGVWKEAAKHREYNGGWSDIEEIIPFSISDMYEPNTLWSRYPSSCILSGYYCFIFTSDDWSSVKFYTSIVEVKNLRAFVQII